MKSEACLVPPLRQLLAPLAHERLKPHFTLQLSFQKSDPRVWAYYIYPEFFLMFSKLEGQRYKKMVLLSIFALRS